jgi:hypothetical protein
VADAALRAFFLFALSSMVVWQYRCVYLIVKLIFAKGAYYDTKMHDVQWSAITVTIKILKKFSDYHYDKNLEQKSESDMMTFLSWTQSFSFQIWISGAIFKSAIHLKIKIFMQELAMYD